MIPRFITSIGISITSINTIPQWPKNPNVHLKQKDHYHSNAQWLLKGLLGGLPPPQVEVFCIHGSEVLIHDDDHDENQDGDDANDESDNKNILTSFMLR